MDIIHGYLYILTLVILILVLTSIKKTRDYLKQYLSEFLTSFGAIGLTVVDVMSDSKLIFIHSYTWKDSWVYLLMLFGTMLIIAVIIGAKRNLHNRTVQSEINKNIELASEIETYKKEYYKLCSNNIFTLFKSFYITGGERISIYKYQGDHFTLLGRYSKNPSHNKPTNYQYVENEGLIGKGWKEGEALVTGAPKWVDSGTKYKTFMKEHGKVSDRRLKKIRMKSRSLFVKNLHDDDTAEDPDGLIVFESLNPTKVTRDECMELINNNEKDILRLLKNMKSLTRKVI